MRARPIPPKFHLAPIRYLPGPETDMSVTIALVLALATSAVSAAPEAPAHNNLRATHAAALKAVASSDLDGLLATLHPNVVFVATSGEIVRGHEGVKAYFERMLVGDNKVIESAKFDQEAKELSILHGGDSAIAFGNSTDSYKLTDGDEFVLATKWSATLVQENDKWLIASFHSSVGVFENAMLDKLKSWALWGGIGALFVGLLLGWLIGRRRKSA